MVTATRFEDTIRRHNFLRALYELYDNKSKFRDMSREYYVARGGDDSEMMFTATFMIYQQVQAKKNDL